MTSSRRILLAVGSGLLVAPLLLAGADASASRADRGPAEAAATAANAANAANDHIKAAEAAVQWQRIAVRTIWAESVPVPAPPVGSMYLSFTSLAVHDAALDAQRQGRVAATAAVATAAHDVLYEYFPLSHAALDADLAATMASIPRGRKADAGSTIGARSAAAMIESRLGDGRFNTAITYSKPAAPGVWQPAPNTNMALAWLGFLRPVIDVPPVALDGPDAIGSPAYAADYNEVASLGSAGSTLRTPEQTAIADFFAPNVNGAYRLAVCDVLDAEPMKLVPTTRMFAQIDAAVVTSFIQTFRLKYDVGYWRPSEAIPLGDTDGNAGTIADAGWTARLTVPGYSDYTSGHAAATAPFAEVVRQTLGDDTPLTLTVGAKTRSYPTLTALEHDALNSRIWGGLHFRDAMDDGYHLGHTTAERVMSALR